MAHRDGPRCCDDAKNRSKLNISSFTRRLRLMFSWASTLLSPAWIRSWAISIRVSCKKYPITQCYLWECKWCPKPRSRSRLSRSPRSLSGRLNALRMPMKGFNTSTWFHVPVMSATSCFISPTSISTTTSIAGLTVQICFATVRRTKTEKVQSTSIVATFNAKTQSSQSQAQKNMFLRLRDAFLVTRLHSLRATSWLHARKLSNRTRNPWQNLEVLVHVPREMERKHVCSNEWQEQVPLPKTVCLSDFRLQNWPWVAISFWIKMCPALITRMTCLAPNGSGVRRILH